MTEYQQSLLSPNDIETDTSDERYTPSEILACVAAMWPKGIWLDPCWDPRSLVVARHTFTLADDCLTKPWPSGNTFMNPPWSAPGPFLERVRQSGNETIAVVKLDTSTAWWRNNIWSADALCFAGRVRFLLPDGSALGTPSFETVIAYYGCAEYRFAEVFSQLGKVVIL